MREGLPYAVCCVWPEWGFTTQLWDQPAAGATRRLGFLLAVACVRTSNGSAVGLWKRRI